VWRSPGRASDLCIDLIYFLLSSPPFKVVFSIEFCNSCAHRQLLFAFNILGRYTFFALIGAGLAGPRGTMHWATEQILALAPDAASAKAGQSLTTARKWLA